MHLIKREKGAIQQGVTGSGAPRNIPSTTDWHFFILRSVKRTKTTKTKQGRLDSPPHQKTKQKLEQTQTAMGKGGRTCVGEIDDGEEDHAGSQGHPEEEEGLELLPGEPVLQVLQEGVGLQQRKHT